MQADNAGARPYGAWLIAFCKRKYNSDFSREMSRSMAEYLKPLSAVKTPGSRFWLETGGGIAFSSLLR